MIVHRPHVCTNWNHLSNWIGERSVHLKGGIIKHAFTGKCTHYTGPNPDMEADMKDLGVVPDFKNN